MFFSQQSTILDDIFDPEKGWSFSTVQVPLQRGAASDGTPFYTVTVDRIDIEVFEITKWANDVNLQDKETSFISSLSLASEPYA